MRAGRRWIAAISVIALGAGLAACGEDTGGQTPGAGDAVHAAGRVDFSYGYAPDLDAAQAERDAYAAELLVFLHTTPQGTSVTRVRSETVFEDTEMIVETNLAPYPPGDATSPAARDSRATVKAVLASAEGRVRQHTAYTVTAVFVRDTEKGGMDSVPIG